MTTRLLLFATIAAIALLFALAVNAPGQVDAAWFGWTVRFHPVWAAGGLLVLLALWHYAGRIWTWLKFRSGLFGAARTLRRQKAAKALSAAALSALVFDQRARAESLAAEALDSDPDNLTAGAIAAFCGDEDQIARLNADPATRPLAALARYRAAPSLERAEAAAKAAPASSAAWQAVTETRARSGDFDGAEAAFSNWHALDNSIDVHAPQIRAALALGRAEQALFEDGDNDVAQEAARRALKRALKLHTDFVPAVIRLAAIAPAGDGAATQAIRRAWAAHPHPALLKAYIDLDPLEDDTARLERVEALAAENEDAAESRIALASAALRCGDPERALEVISDSLHADDLRSAAVSIARTAYQRLGMDPPAHAAWADRDGMPGPAWHCAQCRAVAADWSLECSQCKRIGLITAD